MVVVVGSFLKLLFGAEEKLDVVGSPLCSAFGNTQQFPLVMLYDPASQ